MPDRERQRHELLVERHQAVMPSWVALYYDEPIELVRGDGCRVLDGEGNEYLDLFGGILTTMLGHNVPEVVEAIREQAGKMLHTSSLYLSEPAISLAERISDLAPVPDAKVFLVSSGTEATDTALMLASAFRNSNQVLALRNSYHGRSFAATAVTGNRGWSPSSFSPINVSYAQNGYKYRSPFGHLSDRAFIEACAEDLRNVIETTTAGDVACLIAEPVQGVGGFVIPPDGFFGAMKEVLDEYGVLFISDEVQTGWGRTGEHFWGIQAHDVVPDIITFAKGLGNGLAIGGVAARPEIMDCLGANSISTFGGNPLSAAGALASLEYLLSSDLQTNARRVGAHLLRRLTELAETRSVIGEVRGRGLMIGIEIVEPGETTPAPAMTASIMEHCRAHGILVGKGGLYNNILRLAPPLSLSTEDADEALEVLSEAVATVEKRS